MALKDIKNLFGKRKKAEKTKASVKVEPIKQPAAKKSKTAVAKKPSLVIYKTLKKALISEKTTDLNEKGQYVFLVAKQANKHQIRQAIQDLYGVKVKTVRTINLPAKPRIWRGHHGYRHGLEKGYKKAIVILAGGEKIEILPR